MKNSKTLKREHMQGTTGTPGQAQTAHVNLPAATATTAQQPAHEQADLRLPHERDQAALGVTASEPDPMVVQAALDLASGKVDTDLRNQPGLDAARQRALLRQAL